MSGAYDCCGPTLPIWALQQVGSYLGYSGRLPTPLGRQPWPIAVIAGRFCCVAQRSSHCRDVIGCVIL